MNVGKLRNIICDLPDNMPVHVACQGYSNYDFKNKKSYADSDTLVIKHDGKLFLVDTCALDF